MSKSAGPDFSNASWFRQKFWPIEQHEQKKVLPLLAMMFLTCFNYTLLRDLKDVLVLDSMNASAVPWLKNFVVLPTSVVFMMVFTKMSLSMTRSKIFYSFLGFFLAFFALFGFVLYPLEDKISPGKSWAEEKIAVEKIAKNMMPPLYVMASWPSALLYVMAEMWGTVVLSLLFWGFTNDICRVSEAKRFYTIINIGANFSLLFVGAVLMLIATFVKGSSSSSMYILMSMVVIFGVCIGYIYRWIENNVLTDPRLYDPNESKPKKKKAKLTMMQSFKFLFSSKYIACICAMVFLYGTCINQVELFYKEALGKAYPKFDPTKATTELYSDISSIAPLQELMVSKLGEEKFSMMKANMTGKISETDKYGVEKKRSTNAAEFLGFLVENDIKASVSEAVTESFDVAEIYAEYEEIGVTIRMSNWRSALMTNIDNFDETLSQLKAKSKNDKIFFQGLFSMTTGFIALFLLIFIGGNAVRVMGWTFTALMTPVIIALVGLPLAGMAWAKLNGALTSFTPMLYFGMVAVSLSKSTKYSFFDPTKEMSYIPLDADVKMKGKAAVDVVGARFGKAGGGLLIILVQAIMGSSDVLSISPVLFFLIATFLCLWVASTVSLGKQFAAKQAEKDEEMRLQATQKA